MQDDYSWNLSDILDAKQFDNLLMELEAKLSNYQVFWQQLTPKITNEKFLEILNFDEDYSAQMSRLYDAPALEETVDQQDEQAKKQKNRARELTVKYEDATRKIWLWLKGKSVDGKEILDDTNAKRLFKVHKQLQYSLQHARDNAHYSLAEKEEQIAAYKSVTGVEVLLDLREVMESEQEFILEQEGKKKKKISNLATLMKQVYSTDPDLRKATYGALFKTYQKGLLKYFMIYEAVVKDWSNDIKLRGYKSPISIRNVSNGLKDETVETLLDVCREEHSIFFPYFKLKAKHLGLKKLRRYDLYAPAFGHKDKAIPFEKAKKIVLETFANFSSKFAGFAKEIIDAKHIDVYPKQNKQGGAFCATIEPKVLPYVLLNYTNTMRDVSTLAHELGHGVHSLYARNLSFSVQQATLPLAETASTLGELIVFERLYSEEKDKEIKKSMLTDKIAEAYATIIRQAYFVMFEKEAHNEIPKGLTPEELSELYFKIIGEQFSDVVEMDPIFRYEWSYIPHLVRSPFYCYSYSFGELLSLSLFQMYKERGKEFVDEIEQLLASGRTDAPENLLLNIGIDITKRDFWQEGFRVIAHWISELQGL